MGSRQLVVVVRAPRAARKEGNPGQFGREVGRGAARSSSSIIAVYRNGVAGAPEKRKEKVKMMAIYGRICRHFLFLYLHFSLFVLSCCRAGMWEGETSICGMVCQTLKAGVVVWVDGRRM